MTDPSYGDMPSVSGSRMGACVMNGEGLLLTYTMKNDYFQCKEYQEKNNPFWEEWKSIGCSIVEVEIKVLDTYWSRRGRYEG